MRQQNPTNTIRALVTPQDPLLNTDQAAVYLGVRPSTLENWRVTGRYNLPFVKIGRLPRYRRSDLDAFIARRLQNANPGDRQ